MSLASQKLMCEFKLVCYDWRDSCIEEWLLKEAYIQSISMSNADDEARAGDQPSQDFDITLNINYKLSIPTTSEKPFSSTLNERLNDCGEPSTENQMNYIVVQVDLDYDYIQDVKYINRFTTESEAEKFIQEKLEEQNAQYKALDEYIEKYVEAIELPEANIDHNGWKEFMKKYGFLVTPNEFKKEFQFYLKRNHYSSVNIPGYYPPIVSDKYNNLFIIDASKTDNL